MQQKLQGLRVSRPIVRISVISIALAICVNLLTVAIVQGFQHEVRDKITGFNAPLFISKAGSAHIFEAEAFDGRSFLKKYHHISGVRQVSPVAYKPAMLQSARFSDTIQLATGRDSITERQDILGVVMKGVDGYYDWRFIQHHLKAGRVLRAGQASELVLSAQIARKLNYKLNDEISVYYVRNQPVLRKFKVVGIYQTGLEEYDQKVVFCNLNGVQAMSDFGTKIRLELDQDSTQIQGYTLRVQVEGDASSLLFDWGQGPDIYTGMRIAKLIDTCYRVKAYRYQEGKQKPELLDSASLCVNLNENGPVVQSTEGIGTARHFISGYEVSIDNWEQLEPIKKALKEQIEFQPFDGMLLQVQAITDTEADLFAWLHFLDFNVYIILFLMLLIGIINVGSAMLVLIVIRTSFIGLLKALGTRDWAVRKIFLYQAAYLIARGLFFGNVIGIGLSYVQLHFGWFQLDPEVYYLDRVPIEINLVSILSVNLLTFLTCMLALLIPSMVVMRISPTKAIRFQ
ncbi:MAG: hypothetical protein RLZZ301_543 [Bacteroidota bacterium]